MTYLTPLLLLGVFAAAIPFVLHMLSSVRARQQPFPTLRFLQLSMHKTARRRRVQHWLLLLLRALLLALLAWAVAEPVSRATGGWLGGRRYSAVVVLDNSLSMSARGAAASRFEQAKSQAAALLAGDDKPSLAALLVTNGGTDPAGLTAALETLRDGLEKAAVTGSVAPLADRIRTAAKLMDKQPLPEQSIYVLTDLQKISLDDLAALEKLDNKDKLSLLFIDTSRRPTNNVGISDVRINGRPVTDAPLTFHVTLVNSSPTERKVDLSLQFTGANEPAQRITRLIPAGGNIVVPFRRTFFKPGTVLGEARIETDDDLPADNVRRVALNVVDRVRAVIVRGPISPGAMRSDDPTLMARLALNPFGGRGGPPPGQAWPIVLTGVVDYRAFSAKNLSDVGTAVFCDVPDFTDALARAVKQFVAAGGTAVFFPGPHVRPKQYNAMFGDILPGELGEPTGQVGPDAPAMSAVWVAVETPYFKGLYEKFDDYLTPLVQRLFPLRPVAGVQTLIRLSDDKPLLLVRSVGRGCVLLCATTSSHGWSNLLGEGAKLFVPMLVRAALQAGVDTHVHGGYLPGAHVTIRPQVNRRAGEMPDSLSVSIIRPDDPDGARPSVVKAVRRGDGYEAVFTEMQEMGVYRWTAAVGENQPVSGAFVVNFDGRECELASYALNEVVLALHQRGFPYVYVGRSLAEVNAAATTAARGENWWDRILAVVILLLIVEAVISNRFRQRDQADTISS